MVFYPEICCSDACKHSGSLLECPSDARKPMCEKIAYEHNKRLFEFPNILRGRGLFGDRNGMHIAVWYSMKKLLGYVCLLLFFRSFISTTKQQKLATQV